MTNGGVGEESAKRPALVENLQKGLQKTENLGAWRKSERSRYHQERDHLSQSPGPIKSLAGPRLRPSESTRSSMSGHFRCWAKATYLANLTGLLNLVVFQAQTIFASWDFTAVVPLILESTSASGSTSTIERC